jgi:hypothetical protein
MDEFIGAILGGLFDGVADSLPLRWLLVMLAIIGIVWIVGALSGWWG